MIALCVTLRNDSDVWLLHRGLLPALHALVVAPRLERLVAEVLDRLVVEQAVDRARVRLRVELVHLPPEAGAPVGDEDRRGDVERERRHRDRDERPVVADDEDHRDQADLHQRGQDREQREADQRRDAALAALDVPGQSARLPREMEAQRQRMEVAEHLERDRAHRALRDLGEQELAELGEHRRRQAQEAVGGEQRERNRQHRGPGVERVDDRLQQDRHADVRDLGRDQRDERDDHAPLVRPEVRQQRADHAPVAAAGCLRGRKRRRGVMTHAAILTVARYAGRFSSRRARGPRNHSLPP